MTLSDRATQGGVTVNNETLRLAILREQVVRTMSAQKAVDNLKERATTKHQASQRLIGGFPNARNIGVVWPFVIVPRGR